MADISIGVQQEQLLLVTYFQFTHHLEVQYTLLMEALLLQQALPLELDTTQLQETIQFIFMPQMPTEHHQQQYLVNICHSERNYKC